MQRKRGFTLIELLVVIAIIGILATLVVTQLGNSRVKARVASSKSDIVEAGKAIEAFKNDDAASDQVVLQYTAGVAFLKDAAPSRGFNTLFNGTQSVNGASSTYGVKFNKTPGANYAYVYTTTTPSTTTVAAGAAAFGLGNSVYKVAAVNMEQPAATDATAFCVQNGNSLTGPTTATSESSTFTYSTASPACP